MSITEAEMRRLVTGVKTKNLDELDAVMEDRIDDKAGCKSGSPSERKDGYFVAACALGNPHVVATYLLHRRYDENVLYTGLYMAVGLDAVDVVKMLIEDYRLNPNYILPWDKMVGQKNKPNPGRGLGEHPFLLVAVIQGRIDVLTYFLSLSTIDINSSYTVDLYSNSTALHIAVSLNLQDVVKVLLEHGANPFIARKLVKKPPSQSAYKELSADLGFDVTSENIDQLGIMGKTFTSYELATRLSARYKDAAGLIQVFQEWEARVGANYVQRLKQEAYNLDQPKNYASPAVVARPSLTPPKFSSIDLNGASAFMSRYKDSLVDASLKQLHPLVIAAMEGENFLSIVTCYLVKREFDLEVLYKAIYLAAWFVSEKSIETIINKCHTDLDADTMIKVLEQGRADSERYRTQIANTRKNKTAQQIDAVAQMNKQLSFLTKDRAEKHEHSSDEERPAAGSHSPGHSSDSDKEPKSAGSDNSPPRSPEKLALLPVNEELEKKFFIQKSKLPIDELKKLYFSGVTMRWHHPTSGKTAFHGLAGLQEHRPRVEALLSWGVDINILTRDGQTICHLLCAQDPDSYEYSDLEDLKFLFKKRPYPNSKLNPNLRDKNGNTPLHLAAIAGKPHILTLLLENEGDPTITNNAGQNVLACAQACTAVDAIQSLPQRENVINAVQPYMNKRVAPRPVMQQPAEIKYSQPQPIPQASSYSSPSSPALFKVSPNVASPLPAASAVQIPREAPASQRMAAQQVGALYAAPVSKDSLKLPKKDKTTHEPEPIHSDQKKKSGGIIGKVRGLF